MTTPEGRTKQMVKAVLIEQGFYQFWPVQTGFGQATLDCLACGRGKFYAIETKRPGVITPTRRQYLTMMEIHKAGGIAGVVQSEDDLYKLLGFDVLPR